MAVTIRGLKEANAAFKALPETTRDALNGATEMTVRGIATTAKGRILSSPSIKTRALLNGIGWTMNRRTGRGRAGVQAGTEAARRAHFVEFGTSRMPAEPFMVPATEAEQSDYLARCRAARTQIERGTAAIGMRHL